MHLTFSDFVVLSFASFRIIALYPYEVGPLTPRHGAFSRCGWRIRL